MQDQFTIQDWFFYVKLFVWFIQLLEQDHWRKYSVQWNFIDIQIEMLQRVIHGAVTRILWRYFTENWSLVNDMEKKLVEWTNLGCNVAAAMCGLSKLVPLVYQVLAFIPTVYRRTFQGLLPSLIALQNLCQNFFCGEFLWLLRSKEVVFRQHQHISVPFHAVSVCLQWWMLFLHISMPVCLPHRCNLNSDILQFRYLVPILHCNQLVCNFYDSCTMIPPFSNCIIHIYFQFDEVYQN